MKYMLLIGGPLGPQKDFAALPGEDLERNFAYMNAINDDLRASGEYVDAQGLAPPQQALLVSARDDGPPEVSDGPFPESKEFLAGYWIVDVESRERAIEIAARGSASPGRGGKPVNNPIEVRQIMDAPSLEM